MKLDISGIAAGDRCGFGTFGQYSATLAVSRDDRGAARLAMDVIESTETGPVVKDRAPPIAFAGSTLWIGLDLDFTTDQGRLSYSRDGKRWVAAGGAFPLAFAWRTGTFQGQQMVLSCYNAKPGNGYLDIDRFTLRAAR